MVSIIFYYLFSSINCFNISYLNRSISKVFTYFYVYKNIIAFCNRIPQSHLNTGFVTQYTLMKYGGPDGELGASMRYISQRYSMPYREVSGLLTDIGTDELEPHLWI